jgi:hypothetical protein
VERFTARVPVERARKKIQDEREMFCAERHLLMEGDFSASITNPGGNKKGVNSRGSRVLRRKAEEVDGRSLECRAADF